MATEIKTAFTAQKEVTIEHVFNKPVKLVFDAWINRESLQRWYAPDGCTIEFFKADIRVGGSFFHVIRTPHAKDCWCIGEYLEIVPEKKIAFSIIIADKNGTAISAKEAGMDPEWPQKTIVTVNFESLHNKTRILLRQTVAESIAKRTGAFPSWIAMLERLDRL